MDHDPDFFPQIPIFCWSDPDFSFQLSGRSVFRPAVHSDFIGIIPIFSRKNGLIPIFRFFFADSDFLMALIPIFENLRSVVIHREEKDGEA